MGMVFDSKSRLNNAVEMPRLGLGVYQLPPGGTALKIVKYALKIGYRHIDTARLYGNETDVGRAVMESGIQREEMFVTTKVWNSDQGHDSTLKAFEGSLQRLGLSYVDLYLIHWPVRGKVVETWKAMTKILEWKIHGDWGKQLFYGRTRRNYPNIGYCASSEPNRIPPIFISGSPIAILSK
jgi:methylglyoxal/glyoxal reductase